MAEPATTTGQMFYYVSPPDGSKGVQKLTVVDPWTGQPERNFGREEKPAVIENLRGKEDSVSLDKTGFQYFKIPSKHASFSNDEEIKREYYPESVDIIKELTGASRVQIFDHTIRRRRPGQVDNSPDKRQPVPQAHVDQTTGSAISRVHRHMPAEDAPELLKHRFQIINLWRPISHPAWDWPLALCDYRSVVPEKDTEAMDLHFPGRVGETLGVKYSENYRWKYLRGMTPEEGVLIKCFDSVQDGSVAVFTPHTAFDDPATPKGSPFRESIELRALVFYD